MNKEGNILTVLNCLMFNKFKPDAVTINPPNIEISTINEEEKKSPIHLASKNIIVW